MANKQKSWSSSDKTVNKEIVSSGIFGNKPFDQSVCKIIVNNLKINDEHVETDILKELNCNKELVIVIGEADKTLDIKFEKCLETMLVDEIADVTIKLDQTKTVQCTIKLIDLQFKGYIFDWPANEKYALALKHKEKGVELFKQNRPVDAFYRFSKAIKLLITCAVEVDSAADEIDGIKLSDIDSLKTILYGNLASCHLKLANHEDVIYLCTKQLTKDPDNVKAIYKRALSYTETKDFEKAGTEFNKFLEFEPNHSVARQRLRYIKEELVKSNKLYVDIVKKMFR